MSKYIKSDLLREQMLKYGFRSADQTVTEFVEDTLPTADVPQWIPCSERLPEEDEYVLATTEWDEITIAENIGNDMWFIHEGNTNATTEDIIAWMPLPKPWKGADDE